MKIAFVNQPWDTSSPPHTGGSLAIWSYQVARRLAREQGGEIIVYEKGGPGATLEERIEGVTYHRIETGRVDRAVRGLLGRIGTLRPPRRPHFAHRLHYYDFARQVAKNVRARRCDVVHIHNFSQFVLPVRAYNPTATIVLHMNCDWLAQIDADILDSRLAQCDVVMGCTEHVTEAVRRRFPQHARRCRTVYNGVDTDWFVPQTKASTDGRPGEGTEDGQRVLFCGRVSPEKGVHDLLDACDAVVKKLPGVQLEILGGVGAAPREYMVAISADPKVRALDRFYGKGADYGATLRERMTSEVAARTKFTSFLPQREVADRIRRADVLVLPSLTESFGMPVAEAMASCVPVIASRVGGLPELVEEGATGLLVESANPAALEAALLRLLSNASMREDMGRRGRDRAVQLFSWDRVAEAALACYREAVAARVPPSVAETGASSLSAGVL